MKADGSYGHFKNRGRKRMDFFFLYQSQLQGSPCAWSLCKVASGARTLRMLSRTLPCSPVGGYRLTVLRGSFILLHKGGKVGRALLERQKVYVWVSATTREQVAFSAHALVAQSAEGGGARGDLTVLTMCRGLGATPTTPVASSVREKS